MRPRLGYLCFTLLLCAGEGSSQQIAQARGEEQAPLLSSSEEFRQFLEQAIRKSNPSIFLKSATLQLTAKPGFVDGWADPVGDQRDGAQLAMLANALMNSNEATDPIGRWDQLVSYAFENASPVELESTRRPRALVEAEKTLYVGGVETKGPSAAFQQYSTLLAEWKSAKEAAEAAESAGRPEAQALRLKARNALQRLESLGQKQKIEGALAVYAQLSPSAAWAREGNGVKSALLRSQGLGEFLATDTLPRFVDWSMDEGALRLRFGQEIATSTSSSDTATNSGSQLFSGDDEAVSVLRASWRAGAASLAVRLVAVRRGWESSTIESGHWAWSGKPSGDSGERERYVRLFASGEVCVPDWIVLGGDLRVPATLSGSQRKVLAAALADGRSLSVGTAFLSGGVILGEARYVRPEVRTKSVSQAELQVLGWICHRLEALPHDFEKGMAK